MSVYVDRLRSCRTTKSWKYKESCHMFADTLEELHNMAGLLNLKEKWFQDHINFSHYDLTKSKRILAIEYGAVEVRDQFVIEFIKNKRKENYA